MILRKSRFTIALLWAMIPLTVFGSQPRVGCICANGQHKFFCQRHLQHDADGQCTCCKPNESAQQAESASRVNGQKSEGASCCHCGQLTGTTENNSVRSERPCKPVLDKAVYVAVPKSTLDLDRVDVVPLFLVCKLLPVVTGPVLVDIHRGELLPPPDLVITLGVMLN